MIDARPLLGLSLMLGFCVLAPMADAVAKLLSGAVPLGQLLLVRFAIQALILWPLHRRGTTPLQLGPTLWGLVVLRTALHVAGIGAMVVSLRYLPLADAVAIAFVMPFLLMFLAWLLLGETVGPHRWAACGVGFAGTLMVTQPSFVEVGWAALLPMLVALIFALFILVTRRIAGQVEPVSLQAVSGVIGAVGLLPLVLLAEGRGWPELDPVEPAMREIVLLITLGVLGTVAHLLMTWSLRFAPAATLAPIQYLEIPFAVLYGRIIFAEWPDTLALTGIVVIMGAGLYIVRRERLNA